MSYKMILNKNKFLKTEFGGELQSCITAWDQALDGMRYAQGDELSRKRKAAYWCQAQWEVYKMALRQFYSLDYNFTRTDDYYGLCTDDETDWLFKVYRKENATLYRAFLKEPSCVSGPFTADKIKELEAEDDADLYGVFTAEEYRQAYGMEVLQQL